MKTRRIRLGRSIAAAAAISFVVHGCDSPTNSAEPPAIGLAEEHLSAAGEGGSESSSDRSNHDFDGAVVERVARLGPNGRPVSADEIENLELDHDGSASLLQDGTVLQGPTIAYEPYEAPDQPEMVPVVFDPADKLGPSVTEWISSAPGQKTANVLVSFPSRTKMQRLPLDRKFPRSHDINQVRLQNRGQMIASIAQERRLERGDSMTHVRSFGHPIIKEYALGNSIQVALTAGEILELAEDDGVLSINIADAVSPPPNVLWGRAALGSDTWNFYGFDGDEFWLYVGLIDTGTRPSVVGFSGLGSGTIAFQRDCVYGNSVTQDCTDGGSNLYDPSDPISAHGTHSANIVMGRWSSQPGWGNNLAGISDVKLDTFNVYTHANFVNPGTTDDATLDAINAAVSVGDAIIAANVQSQQNFAGAVSLAADDAYDVGSMVLGAAGNAAQVADTGAPGNAHKALSIGDYDAQTNAVTFQVSNNADDGRYKPDIQMPTNVNTASSNSKGCWFNAAAAPSDTTTCNGYNGTSAATAHAAGAAALVLDYFSTTGLNPSPGKLYSALIALGDRWGAHTTDGAGRVRLPACANFWSGQRTVSGSGNQDITINVPGSRKNLKAAIWWPEEVNASHQRIQLRVYNPSGSQVDSGTRSAPVFQIAGQSGNVASGNWKIRLDPYGSVSSQIVYYTVVAQCQ